VGGEVATTWLGFAGRLRLAGSAAQAMRRIGRGDWDHRIRLDERIRDEMNGVDNSVGHRDARLVGRGLWEGCGGFPNLISLRLHTNAFKPKIFTPEWRANFSSSFFLKKRGELTENSN